MASESRAGNRSADRAYFAAANIECPKWAEMLRGMGVLMGTSRRCYRALDACLCERLALRDELEAGCQYLY